jgi:hypothetical protein
VSAEVVRRVVIRAALAAALILLVSSVSAAADTVSFSTPCNPATAEVTVDSVSPINGAPLFLPNGVAWVDYFGIPVAFSPFTLQPIPGTKPLLWVADWAFPNPSSLLAGQYTLHVLLQGNPAAFGLPLALFVFITLSDTATINPSLPYGCTPTAIATSALAARAETRPPVSVLARRVRALRRTSGSWFGRSFAPRSNYPRARLCGQTVCVQLRAGERWKPVTGG